VNRELNGTKGALRDDISSMERKGKSPIGNRIFVHHRIVSGVKRVEFVSDRVAYKVLRSCWCNIIFGMCMEQVRRKVIQKTVFMRN